MSNTKREKIQTNDKVSLSGNDILIQWGYVKTSESD